MLAYSARSLLRGRSTAHRGVRPSARVPERLRPHLRAETPNSAPFLQSTSDRVTLLNECQSAPLGRTNQKGPRQRASENSPTGRPEPAMSCGPYSRSSLPENWPTRVIAPIRASLGISPHKGVNQWVRDSSKEMIMRVLACGILLAGLETGAVDEFDLECGGSGHIRDVDRRTIGQRGHSRLDENRYALAAQAFDVLG